MCARSYKYNPCCPCADCPWLNAIEEGFADVDRYVRSRAQDVAYEGDYARLLHNAFAQVDAAKACGYVRHTEAQLRAALALGGV